MPRDSRERIEASDPLTQSEEYQYQSLGPEPPDEQPVPRDYAPEYTMPSPRYDYTAQELAGIGISDAEIIRLQRQGAVGGRGGMVEYDEEQEHRDLQQRRARQTSIAALDAGDSLRTQLSEMEAYFAGKVPNSEGKYCKRHPYVSPEDEIVAIQGYIFQIPKYRRVMLPEEVLNHLFIKASAARRFEVLSAVYAARQFGAVEGGDPDTYAARIRANHHVKLDLIPGNEMPVPR